MKELTRKVLHPRPKLSYVKATSEYKCNAYISVLLYCPHCNFHTIIMQLFFQKCGARIADELHHQRHKERTRGRKPRSCLKNQRFLQTCIEAEPAFQLGNYPTSTMVTAASGQRRRQRRRQRQRQRQRRWLKDCVPGPMNPWCRRCTDTTRNLQQFLDSHLFPSV